MRSKELYDRLEKDFIKIGLSDDWSQYMKSIYDFISDNFKKRSMGLVCDNSENINKVYTAVFPSDKVMKFILGKMEKQILLFVHHPSIWDIRKAPEVFQQMNKSLLENFKERRISIYNLHVPLDNYGKYSTSFTLSKVLGIKVEKPFAPYFGALCGIFGKTNFSNVQELKKRLEDTICHKASLYNYGTEKIKNEKVAIIAGGGNSIDNLEEIVEEKINTFVSGITVLNNHSQKAHEYAKENKINILGGTHYSTEKFACIAMCKYFEKIGLPSEFIEDTPVLEDI